MIVSSQVVQQRVATETPEEFLKQVLVVSGPEPLSLVRKRLPAERLPHGHTRGAVLLTHGFGQNRYAWHLSSRSFANHLAKEGYDVFNFELRGHGRSRLLGARMTPSVDEYILEDFPAALREVQSHTDGKHLFVLGHSLGGIVSCCAAARAENKISGLVAIGIPWHFSRGSWFLQALTHAVRLASKAQSKRGSRVRIPVEIVGSALQFTRAAWDSPWIPLPVRAWHPGSLSREELQEYLTQSMDSASLGTLMQLCELGVTGTLHSRDGKIDWSRTFEHSQVPLLVVAGTHDLLAPVASVRPAFTRSQALDRSWLEVPCGHADLLVGQHAPELTWPAITSWLHAHATS